MKRRSFSRSVVILCALAFGMVVSRGQTHTNTLILPREMETSFGGSRVDPLFEKSRWEHIYVASAFDDTSADIILITEIAFRVDEGYTNGMDATLSRLRMQMNVFPGTLDEIVEQGGGTQLPITGVFDQENLRFIGRTGTIEAFDIRFPLQTPFLYDRRLGHLVLGLYNFGNGGGRRAALDAEYDPVGFSITYEAAPYYNPVFLSCLVTKFSYIIPPQIDSVRRIGDTIEIDFSHSTVSENFGLEASTGVTGPYVVAEEVEFVLLSAGRTRAVISISTGDKFFRIRENM